MGRKSHVALSMEEQRLQIIHSHQTALRKRLSREIRVSKARGPKSLPGEVDFKKNMAIFLKIGVPGISYKDIGARIGETKTVVKNWFADDPYVREQYEFIQTHLKTGAVELLEFYTIEAIETLVLLMRFGAEKVMLSSAMEILDRVGIAKLTKSESEIKSRREYGWEDQSALLEDIRKLPPELQEEAITGLEKLQALISGEAPEADDEIDTADEGELKPIVGPSDEEEDEEDGNVS